jgi:soluble lytic murein transglycosylase-like protein
VARRIALSLVLSFVGVAPASARTDARPSTTCATVAACRSELARARAAIAWQRSVRQGLERRLRVRFLRDVTYGARLASVTYGISASQLQAVAACESGGNRYAQNPSGASGPMQFLPSTWRRNPYGAAGFSVFDPVAALLGAARIVRSEGWREWVCRP